VQIDDAIGLRYLPHQCGTVVTLGATGTNLVTIREKMAAWDPVRVHGSVLGYDEVSLAFEHLSSLGDAGRAAVVGIEKGREHTLHAGALILERALYALGAEECSVSVRGWRHALLEEP
jgi:exopolyphosphatase/guanosine-5'-triphosphate,3'-diphosphate pyrophosphatase